MRCQQKRPKVTDQYLAEVAVVKQLPLVQVRQLVTQLYAFLPHLDTDHNHEHAAS